MRAASTQPGYIRFGRAVFPLAVALVAVGVQLVAAQAVPVLEYQRAAIEQGQWWRLLTGHLAHLSWAHLWLNLAGLALVWLLFGWVLNAAAWLITLLAAMLGVSLGLLIWEPGLTTYVGLSGVLHGLIVAGAIAAIRTGERRALIMVAAVGAKVVVESFPGPSADTEALIGGQVVTDSHLCGAVTGVAVGLLLPRFFLTRTES